MLGLFNTDMIRANFGHSCPVCSVFDDREEAGETVKGPDSEGTRASYSWVPVLPNSQNKMVPASSDGKDGHGDMDNEEYLIPQSAYPKQTEEEHHTHHNSSDNPPFPVR